MTLTQINALIEQNSLDEALAELDALIAAEGQSAPALFMRGKVHWRLGHRSQATSDYAASASLDPEGPAVQALEQARAIEAFFNPDLLNP